jgi:hypothetical protein
LRDFGHGKITALGAGNKAPEQILLIF